jgi:glutathione S-transferase
MYTLYDFADSGNGYKVRLALHQLSIPYRLVAVDILRGETRTPEFLAKNPNGRIPLLELPDGSHLPESNAILFHVARGSALVPSDPVELARVLSWMFFEQYSHEPYVATSRYLLRHVDDSEQRRDELARRKPRAHAALAVMEGVLARAPFFVGATYTIADIALYAYTHRAPEGGIDLDGYPAIRAWITRVEAQPNWLPMLVD